MMCVMMCGVWCVMCGVGVCLTPIDFLNCIGHLLQAKESGGRGVHTLLPVAPINDSSEATGSWNDDQFVWSSFGEEQQQLHGGSLEMQGMGLTPAQSQPSTQEQPFQTKLDAQTDADADSGWPSDWGTAPTGSWPTEFPPAQPQQRAPAPIAPPLSVPPSVRPTPPAPPAPPPLPTQAAADLALAQWNPFDLPETAGKEKSALVLGGGELSASL